MAVLNITPDSFSDGGKLFDGQASLMRFYRMLTVAWLKVRPYSM